MNNLLDIIGSMIIAGTISVMVIQFNTQMQRSAEEIFKSAVGQQSARDAAEIFESDMYRIGNRVVGQRITLADSVQIEFRGDIDNNLVADTIRYYMGTPQSISRQYEKPLYRKLGNSNPQLVALVSELSFSYFDSLGVELPSFLLTNPVVRNRIKTIGIRLITRSPEYMGNDNYQSTEWLRRIRPMNL